MNNIFVVTAFGTMIDTICEVFKSREDALRFIQKQWDDIKKVSGEIETETICDGIWKTNDSTSQTIEWQLHKRTI